MNRLPGKVTFGGVLLLVGVLYVSLSFFTGETLFQMPISWFVTWMANIFQQMDEVGFFNVWSGQSPGFNYLYFILWKPAQILASGQYYFALAFSLTWGLLSIGSLFLGAHYFYKIVAHLWGETKGIILGTIFILLFLTMPQWYTVIDTITITGLLAAIYFSFTGHHKLGGIVLGITATLKPFGLLILPVLLKSEFLSWKARLTIIISSILSFVILLLPLMIGNFNIFISSLNWQSQRPPWESIYSLAMWLFQVPYPDNPLFQDGSGTTLHDWGLTGITPSPAIMTSYVPSGSPWYNGLFVLLLGLVVIGFILFKRIRSQDELLSGMLLMIGAYFTFFYGWSMQFVFWLVPFMLVGFPLYITVTLRFLVLLEYPFLYALYLSQIAPEIVGAAPGLTIAMTAAIAPFGALAYWSVIIVRTILIFTVCIIVWTKLPTQFWNPVSELTGLRNFQKSL